MIVRESVDSWLLISQVDHAAVAAEIAAVWRPPASLTGQLREFAYAVAHHDDGWIDWGLAPTIDDEGRPRDFMDMKMPVATQIWRDSIDICAAESPWCGLWVSRHFCYLAGLAVEHRESSPDQTAAQQFLIEQAGRQRKWRDAIGQAATDDGQSPAEVAGLQGLQFFDRLSLWLCCAERTKPLEVEDPVGGATRWEPVDAQTIRVHADAFNAPELTLSAPTIAVPAREYSSDAELRSVIADGAQGSLNWTLIRGTPSG